MSAPIRLRVLKKVPHLAHLARLDIGAIEKRGPFDREIKLTPSAIENADLSFHVKMYRPFVVSHIVVVNAGAPFNAHVHIDNTGEDTRTFCLPKGQCAIPLARPSYVQAVTLCVHADKDAPPTVNITEMKFLTPRGGMRTRALAPVHVPFMKGALDSVYMRSKTTGDDEVASARRTQDQQRLFLELRRHPIRLTYAALFGQILGALTEKGTLGGSEEELLKKVTSQIQSIGNLTFERYPKVRPDSSVHLEGCEFPVHSFIMNARCKFFRDGMVLPLTLQEALPSLYYIYTGDLTPVVQQYQTSMQIIEDKPTGNFVDRVRSLVLQVCSETPFLIFPPQPYVAACLLGSASLMSLCEDIALQNTSILLSSQMFNVTGSTYMAEKLASTLVGDAQRLVVEGHHLRMPEVLLRALIGFMQTVASNSSSLSNMVFYPDGYSQGVTEAPFETATRPSSSTHFVVARRSVDIPEMSPTEVYPAKWERADSGTAEDKKGKIRVTVGGGKELVLDDDLLFFFETAEQARSFNK